jgi:hypothetical protein
VNLRSGQVAALVPQQTEPKTRGPLLPKGGLHLNPVAKEILGKLPHGLAALHGRHDGRVEGRVQVRNLNLGLGHLRGFLGPVLVVRDGHQARLPLQAAADRLGFEAVPSTVDSLPVVVRGRRGDVEVLLGAVEVLDGMEGAVLVAEPLQRLSDLVLGLFQGHALTQRVRDGQVDDLVLQGVQAGDQAELPGKPRGVHGLHVRGDQAGVLLEHVVGKVERRLGRDDLEDHGSPTSPRRIWPSTSRSSASCT